MKCPFIRIANVLGMTAAQVLVSDAIMRHDCIDAMSSDRCLQGDCEMWQTGTIKYHGESRSYGYCGLAGMPLWLAVWVKEA